MCWSSADLRVFFLSHFFLLPNVPEIVLVLAEVPEMVGLSDGTRGNSPRQGAGRSNPASCGSHFRTAKVAVARTVTASRHRLCWEPGTVASRCFYETCCSLMNYAVKGSRGCCFDGDGQDYRN